jgi:transposase
MAIADRRGLPISARVESASPHEVKLVDRTIESRFIRKKPKIIIGDLAYDSDPLDEEIWKKHKIEIVAPHKENRVKPPTQDGRQLRRYRNRWKVERLFSWLQSYRRIQTRWEIKSENFQAMVHLGCILILFRNL